jgi:hypothetical protein
MNEQGKRYEKKKRREKSQRQPPSVANKQVKKRKKRKKKKRQITPLPLNHDKLLPFQTPFTHRHFIQRTL